MGQQSRARRQAMQEQEARVRMAVQKGVRRWALKLLIGISFTAGLGVGMLLGWLWL